MATLEQEKKEKETLQIVLDTIHKMSVEDLIRTELGTDLNFESGRIFFERYIKLYSDLRQTSLDNVPYETISQLRSQAQTASQKLEEIKEFAPRQHSNPFQVRDQYINQLRDQYDGHWRVVAPVLAFAIRKGTDFEALENKARANIVSQEDAINNFQNRQKDVLKDLDGTLEKVRRAAEEIGISQHSLHFRTTAEEHNTKAKYWLFATICTALLIAAWGAVTFYIEPKGNPPTTAELIHFGLSKLIILSALYYALVWCAKNFSAHRHNYVVNKHRQNALSTFQAFTKAAEEDIQTKHAILLQATQSIFSAQSSGYTIKDSDSDSPNKIVEILRTISSSKNQS